MRHFHPFPSNRWMLGCSFGLYSYFTATSSMGNTEDFTPVNLQPHKSEVFTLTDTLPAQLELGVSLSCNRPPSCRG